MRWFWLFLVERANRLVGLLALFGHPGVSGVKVSGAAEEPANPLDAAPVQQSLSVVVAYNI